WVAMRASAQDFWQLPINMNLDNQDKCKELGVDPGSCPTVNTAANDGAAALSWDEQTMLLYSNRAGGLGGNDLYISTRRKLRSERLRLERDEEDRNSILQNVETCMNDARSTTARGRRCSQ
ncbi:MAG TPA: hypothetical protein VFE08_07155, partial [Candidatus Sulfotelmatobacter sp.]|nr:hypothetical protein [Candidatus Sulfotelmatobacter sp.]